MACRTQERGPQIRGVLDRKVGKDCVVAHACPPQDVCAQTELDRNVGKGSVVAEACPREEIRAQTKVDGHRSSEMPCLPAASRRPVSSAVRQLQSQAMQRADGPSHDDKSSDLMYGDSTPTPGTIVRRKRI